MPGYKNPHSLDSSERMTIVESLAEQGEAHVPEFADPATVEMLAALANGMFLQSHVSYVRAIETDGWVGVSKITTSLGDGYVPESVRNIPFAAQFFPPPAPTEIRAAAGSVKGFTSSLANYLTTIAILGEARRLIMDSKPTRAILNRMSGVDSVIPVHTDPPAEKGLTTAIALGPASLGDGREVQPGTLSIYPREDICRELGTEPAAHSRKALDEGPRYSIVFTELDVIEAARNTLRDQMAQVSHKMRN